MVNVVGRSKGCKNCRQRKIKCSAEEPACMRCVRSGRICLGYQRERVFIYSDVFKEAEKEKRQYRTKGVRSERISLGLERSPLPNHDQQLTNLLSIESAGSFPDLRPSYALISASLRQQLLSSYVGRYQTMSSLASPDGCTWLAVIPSMPRPMKALETAAYALSLARLGTSTNARDMVEESLRLYTRGLYHIQGALWNPKFMYADETLATCVLLAMYEVFQCPNNSRAGYFSHENGCAKLIQLRGPAAHASGLAHSIFQWFRYMSTFEALRTKSTFLADEAWMTLPFSKFRKSPVQRLLDQILQVPMIWTRMDQLQTLPLVTRTQLSITLARDCLKVEGDLQAIYRGLDAEPGGPAYWPSTFDRLRESADLVPMSYMFPELTTAMTVVLSWAAFTVFWSTLSRLYRDIAIQTRLKAGIDGSLTGQFTTTDGLVEDFSLPSPTRFVGFPKMARNVYQSVDYCLHFERGVTIIACPLAMILEGLAGWPGLEKEYAQARDMLAGTKRKGMNIMEHFCEQL